MDYDAGSSNYNGAGSNNDFNNELSGSIELYASNHVLDTTYYRNNKINDSSKTELLTFSKTDYNGKLGGIKATNKFNVILLIMLVMEWVLKLLINRNIQDMEDSNHW